MPQQEEKARLNPVLAKSINKILSDKGTQAERDRFLRALEYSVLGDGKLTATTILSPAEISSKTRISLEELFDYTILVDRHSALAFLKTLGYKPKAHALRKKLGTSYWQRLFPDRAGAVVGLAFVFTYLEILTIEKRVLGFDMDDYIPPKKR